MIRQRVRAGRAAAGCVAAIGLVVALSACGNSNRPDAPAAAATAEPDVTTVTPAPTTQRFATFTSPSTKPFAPLSNQQDLHNSHVVTGKVISGAQPEGDRSFALLKEMGVRTIISVDGAQPDVDGARKYGMRYVHLPIGYDGVDAAEGKAIAKALNELDGPIYVHCHHGRHRSAAALAVACVNNGMLQSHQAEDVLRTFGTGENYKGLWKDARAARRVDDRELADLQIQWVETAKIPAIAEAMVKVEFHNDHLKSIQKAGWTSPPDHPDLDPAHEALQLQEHFREIGRTADTRSRPAGYAKLLTASEEAAVKLRDVLSATPVDTRAADAAFKVVATSCTSCHRDYRD